MRRATLIPIAITSVSSALLLWAASPPLGLGPLAWFALVPVFALVFRAPERRGARAAIPLAYVLYLELLLVPALPFGLTDDQWGDVPVPVLIGGSPVLPVALLLVPLFGAALWLLRFPLPWPAPGAAARWRPGIAAAACIAVPAVSWAALDFARVKLDPGGLFGPLFVSQAGGPAASLGALAGPWLVTLSIVAVNCALAQLVARVRAGAAAAAVTAAALTALLVAAPSADRGGRALSVAVVQPGYDTAEFDRPVLRYFHEGTYDLAALDMVRDLGALTRRAARGGAELVVWPEAALWVDPRRTTAVRRALERLARTAEVTLVVPYFLPDPAEGATVTVGPNGAFSRSQPKQRPMWFWGEGDGNRAPPRAVATPLASIGTTLGVDNQDPRPGRLLAEHGAELVTSSTHDWRQLAPAQRALARLHAVESSVPVVRADWRYGSAIYDAAGEAVADAGTGRRRTVVAGRVGAGDGSTPYVAVGDVPGLVLGVGALVLLAAGAAPRAAARISRRRRASRARGASPPRRRPAPSSPS